MSTVIVEQRGHVLLAILNRPEVMNAVNAELALGLGTAIDDADNDPAIRAVVLAAAGGNAFCAGADLKAVARGESIQPPGHPEWGFAGYVKHLISKPTIAAVTGYALGGGTELALASDLVIAGRSSSFGLPEVKRGLMAAAGGAVRITAQIPQKIAMRMLLTGEPLPATEAERWGLINEVVDDVAVLDRGLQIAELIAQNAPLSVQATKRVALDLRGGLAAIEAARWQRCDEENRALRRSGDSKEGPRAFAEKRAPIWKAR
jgi:crotonobetainyl-CoA hydratase